LVFSIVYLLWSLAYFIYHYFESIQEKEIQNISNQAKISEIELQNLKSQLNPHFLFNAMNSIKALISEDPQKAREAVTQLASILRYSLNTNKNQLVTLESEMILVKNYLQLEKIRYEERLIFNIEYDDNLKNIKVPPLMIQTLVENAIKHGIARLPMGGEISLRMEKNADVLEIKIENPGKLDGESLEKGIGLENTKERLKILFKKGYDLKIVEREGKIITHLIIPII
jgi:two-component system, LytTR family, sensor kinase